ncbi:MAG: MgtC/SapB family protein [Chthonomonadales bacterium]
MFFGIAFQQHSVWGMTAVMLLSVALGALIGFEREAHGHPAGIRTHILVCLGSTLITLVSANMGNGSNDRIAAQIVTGVGFLGAGAIIRDGATVRGLTTAASIWVTAAIGIALGTSPWFGQVACICAGIVLVTLWGLTRMERWIDRVAGRPLLLDLTITDDPGVLTEIRLLLEKHGSKILSVSMETGKDAGTRLVNMKVAPALGADSIRIVEYLSDHKEVNSVRCDT